MIYVLDHTTLQDTQGTGSYFHLQVIHWNGGFQCVAQHGATRLRMTDKSPAGLRYSQAKLAYENAISTRVGFVPIETPFIPGHAPPYNDNPWSIADEETRYELINHISAGEQFDDPEHKERVAAQARDALLARKSEQERRQAEHQAWLERMDAEINAYYRELVEYVLTNAHAIPVFRVGTTFIDVTKTGGTVETDIREIAVQRNTSPTNPQIDVRAVAQTNPEAIAYWESIAREIGGSFTMRLMEFGGHFFRFIGPPCDYVRRLMVHDVEPVFTYERRLAIINSAIAQHAEVLLVNPDDPGPGIVLTVPELEYLATLLPSPALEPA